MLMLRQACCIHAASTCTSSWCSLARHYTTLDISKIHEIGVRGMTGQIKCLTAGTYLPIGLPNQANSVISVLRSVHAFGDGGTYCRQLHLWITVVRDWADRYQIGAVTTITGTSPRSRRPVVIKIQRSACSSIVRWKYQE